MTDAERTETLETLKSLMLLLKEEGELRRFPFFVHALDILESSDQSQEALQEFKTLLLRGMEFVAPGSFSDLGFWRENKEERLEINRRLDSLSKRLLELVKMV
jgi:hypothetical protein